MKVIGITGGAGSGKSVVLDILKNDYNAHVIIADDLARSLSQKGGISYVKIVETFGTEILDDQGEINRQKLAAIVFSNKEKLDALNAITHPDVRHAIEDEIKLAKTKDQATCIVIEAALLIECGYKAICDELWFIYTDSNIRRTRMKETRGYSDKKIDGILKSQLSDKDFMDNCDKIIYNNTTVEDLKQQLNQLFVEK